MNLLEIEMKYEVLKDEFIELNGRKLYRIKALKNFCHIEKGEVVPHRDEGADAC